MEKGKIVQQGTPEELALQAGYYQLIHKIQSQIEVEVALSE